MDQINQVNQQTIQLNKYKKKHRQILKEKEKILT